MIKLFDILLEVNTYHDDSNTWTHVTDRDETIQAIKNSKKFLGRNEDLSEFEYDVQKGLAISKNNPNSPNFYKGTLYTGVPKDVKYIITFTSNVPYPGDEYEAEDWSKEKYPFIPNGNRVNRKSFKKSANIGILKPEYRDSKNFKFYKYNPQTQNHEEFDINSFKAEQA